MLDLLEACAEGPENPEDDPEYYRTLRAREEFTRAFVNLMAQNRLEALMYPSVQLAPPTREVLDSGKWTTLTFPTNTLVSFQTWTPVITVPAGFTEDGLPVGAWSSSPSPTTSRRRSDSPTPSSGLRSTAAHRRVRRNCRPGPSPKAATVLTSFAEGCTS